MIRSELAPAFVSAFALAWASAFALACASCSAPATCDVEQFASGAPALETEGQSGSVRFSAVNESLTLRFRATLGNLPELWPNDSMVIAGLPFELSFRYEREPFGADGRTEMPRLSVAVAEPGGGGGGFIVQTMSYPGPTPLRLGPSLFQDCAFGSQTCQTVFPVRIERSAGAPFPPVRVSWRASVNARINVCSALASHTRATLEVETP